MNHLKITLAICYFLLAGIAIGQTTLTFRLANPRTIRVAGVDNFEFDIQVKALAAGTYLYSGQGNLTFDITTLPTSKFSWSLTKGPLLTGSNRLTNAKYGLVNTIVPTTNVFNIAWLSDVGVSGIGPNATDYSEITTVFQTLVTVRGNIVSATGLAGIDFVQSSMNGSQAYCLPVDPFYAYYTVPNSYDPGNFLTTYVARLYSTAWGWSQAGNVIDAQWVDWTAPVNTSVWDGAATIPATGVSNASNLRIHTPATLTLPATGQLTVTANTEVDGANGLTIQSDATGTGSLITGSTSGLGSAVAQRWMSAGKWNIVSAPLANQLASNFLTTNPLIATNGTARGMMDYNPVLNKWNAFLTDVTSRLLETGKGFSMRLQGPTPAAVTFAGTLQAGAINSTLRSDLLVDQWNCVGNPYTSAIGINTISTTTENFLTVNAAKFAPLYGAIYMWEEPDASNGLFGKYTVTSNATGPDTYIQQGQAFMVNMLATAPQFNFTSNMQIHNPGLTLKSANSPWPTINLKATVNKQNSSTVITFNSAMTKGLDPTYDAGLLKGASDLVVYSKMVEGDAVPLAIQALPENNNNDMIIPIGIDFKTGGEVVFSAELLNLNSGSKVILEDKLAKTFTDLSNGNYTVSIPANSSISNRFQLHSTDLVSGILGNESLKGQLSAFAIKNIEIRVVGEVSSEAIATLYDVQGKAVLIKNMKEGSLNVIPTTNIKIGIYMLSVNDKGKVQTFKLLIRE